MSLKTNPKVCPKKPIKNNKKRMAILYCPIAIAPITGDTPVNTALNERASFRYSRIILELEK